eukprot:766605-Hanusia_phi.AAC.10
MSTTAGSTRRWWTRSRGGERRLGGRGRQEEARARHTPVSDDVASTPSHMKEIQSFAAEMTQTWGWGERGEELTTLYGFQR